MKTRTKTQKFLAAAVALALVASLWVSWGATPAKAIIIVTGNSDPFGVTQSQKVRTSILNSAYDRGGITPCVKVLDMSGAVVAEYEGTTPLMVGEGTFFDFDPAMLDIRGADRAQLRVEIEFEPTPGPDGRTQRLRTNDVIGSVEVFDKASGGTGFMPPVTMKIFNPQPEPPAE